MAFVGFACTNTDERLPIAAEPEPTSAMLQTRSGASSNYEVVPNPYSLANMQAVYNELVGNGTLQPTDLYVRFLPQDSLQMNRLKSDLNLELFDYPLDLQIEDGEVYVDPTIPSGQLTWQYTTVPANFVFPTGITHQILEQCYIPRDDQGVVTRSDGTMVNIEEAAFERVNYPAYSEPDRLFGLFEGKYPQGTITVYDDVEGEYVPVTGVKVRCHIVVKWATDFTDDNGFYKMTSKFPVGPHYAIVFDNSKGFDIWGNWGPLARANYNMGWHSKNGFSKAIPAGSQAWPWAVVNNAGYEYYTMCQQTGIAKPPSNLKIWVSDFLFNQGSAPMIRRVWHPIGINGNGAWANFLPTWSSEASSHIGTSS